MLEFSFLIAVLLSVHSGFMQAADDVLSESELILDITLHRVPLLDHTSVCALALVNKKISKRVDVTKDVRRIALEGAVEEKIVKDGYTVLANRYYDPEWKNTAKHRALHFLCNSSIVTALVILRAAKLEASCIEPTEVYVVQAYCVDRTIKIQRPKFLLMLKMGLLLPCGPDIDSYRGISYIVCGGGSCAFIPKLYGPIPRLKEKSNELESLSFVRGLDTQRFTYYLDGKEETNKIYNKPRVKDDEWKVYEEFEAYIERHRRP